MAFAISLKTESSDSYLYVFDGKPSQEDIIDDLREKMGDEFDYICDYNYKATYSINFFLSHSDDD